jgi:tetratricopeptide (TPR) repeat protein/transcriptional regulator with XRE-family HTH domain
MSQHDTPAFGALLRHYRLLAGLTQEALAERAHLSTRAVSALEQGISRAPRAATLALLTEALAPSAEARAALVAAAQQQARTASPAPAGGSAAPPLAGRAQELALLDRHLTGEGPPLLLLAGEPGIGKSRLLREADQRAAMAGWQVLRAGCTRTGGQPPYTPLLQALQREISGQPVARQRLALRGCSWLVRLLPELVDRPIEPLPPWTISPEQERRLMFGAVERFLANIAGPAGTLLLLDDLQWAGADALDLLSTLIHQPPEATFRVVGAYRTTEVAPDHPLSATLAELAEAQLLTLQIVRPLAHREAEELLVQLRGSRVQVNRALTAQVVQRIGGVPFFLVSYARSLEGGGVVEPAGPGVPWDLRQSIRRRVLALPALGRELLAMAAVAGRVTPRPLLMAVLARPETEVLDALDSACQAGLLEEVGDDAYGFVHDVIREVVEGDLGRARLAILHRRTAEALEGRPCAAPAAVLAYHYGRSDVVEKALLYLEQAGDAAMAQAANGAADGYYTELVTRLEGLGRAVEAARIREKLGAVLHRMAQLTRALDVLEQAAAARGAVGDLEGLGRVLARIGRVHVRRGTLAEGVARLTSHLEALGAGGPSPSLAEMYTALIELHQWQRQFPAALAAAIQAEAVARALEDDVLLARAVLRRGRTLTFLGRAAEAQQAVQVAALRAEAVGDLEMMGWAAEGLTILAGDRGDFRQAQQHASRLLEIGERLGDPSFTLIAQAHSAAQAFFTGAWGEAHAYLERVREHPDRSPANDTLPLLERGRLLLAEGDWEQAAGYLQEGSARARSGAYNHYLILECLLAEHDLLRGQPGMAVARLLPLLDPDGKADRPVIIHVLPVLAWAYLEQGERELATRTIEEAVQRQRERQYWRVLVDSLWVQARLALGQGTVQQAADALEEGLRLARPMPYPHGEGRLLEVSGRLHLEQGANVAAREHLEAALAIFQRLGARKDAKRAEQLVQTLG